MEQYREKLKLQNIFLAAGSVLLLIFAFGGIGSELGWFTFLKPTAGDTHWQSAYNGYITGIGCGLGALLAAGFVRNLLALKNEKKLKKLYIKEYDERSLMIWTNARNTAMQLILIMGLVASIIAGYFSITVSITILACTFTASMVSMALGIYYSQKF